MPQAGSPDGYVRHPQTIFSGTSEARLAMANALAQLTVKPKCAVIILRYFGDLPEAGVAEIERLQVRPCRFRRPSR
jgi:hypothetical protein